jgi:hypothetical protein
MPRRSASAVSSKNFRGPLRRQLPSCQYLISSAGYFLLAVCLKIFEQPLTSTIGVSPRQHMFLKIVETSIFAGRKIILKSLLGPSQHGPTRMCF